MLKVFLLLLFWQAFWHTPKRQKRMGTAGTPQSNLGTGDAFAKNLILRITNCPPQRLFLWYFHFLFVRCGFVS
jgi:hypothetical protein